LTLVTRRDARDKSRSGGNPAEEAAKGTTESVWRCAYVPAVRKDTTMHIASALTVVRRVPVQSDVPMARGHRATGQHRDAGWRKIMPGAILLAVLVLLGGLFPALF
jgi:hypothetical protein